MSEQRKSHRQSCLVPVEGQHHGIFDHTRTVDFSEGGMGIISDHEIPLNQEIAIEIDFNGPEDYIVLKGKVAWVCPDEATNKYRVGLSFKNLYSDSKPRLNDYFNSLKN